jgi:hypothetical protein
MRSKIMTLASHELSLNLPESVLCGTTFGNDSTKCIHLVLKG